MGRKKGSGEKVEEKQPEPPAKEEKVEAEDKPEDPPIVKDLKVLDDKYLAIEREYEKAVEELQRKFAAKQAPLLEQRTAVLRRADGGDAEAATTGTPALKGFWLQAMKNLPALEDQVEEWDEPVLEYLFDIRKNYLDDNDLHKGFKLEFHFVENPFFSNDVLWKEYHTKEMSPYTGEMDTTEIKVCEINWKPGKNVTVETIKKKTKGGGAKKAKQKGKEKEEPRYSFFRNFFRHLKPGMPVPDDVHLDQEDSDDEEEDEDELVGILMENDFEVGCSIRDQLIPFAVRWYTGEAAPEDDDEEDDEDEEEEEDDEDDEESEEESEDEPAPKKKGQQPKRRPEPAGDKKKGGDAGGAKGNEQQECKQQ